MLYCFLILLSLTTICGNLLVIISVFYFKQLHTPTNFLILSLAVADLLVGIIVFPLSMAFSLSSCMNQEGLFYRYYAVCHPLTYKSKISRHVVVVMIAVSWIVSALIAIAVMTPRLEEQCQEECFVDVFIANAVGSILSFYLPVLIMLCIYLKIFLVAQRQARSIQSKMKCGVTVSKLERKATKTLATVLGVFLFCWTPFFLCISFQPFIKYLIVPAVETLNWVALTNSTINPLIYALFYSWFRSAFKIIISGKILHSDFACTKLN
ncbi:trace amine-associated receptor 1-like [Nematolebias whitei]|uniref:trace amine-associated receptor 1-like n=1 Tax=Nematolebias whitei TaxID=451745 RepID=UPI0018984D68|nr:trace amine-associated receptor 1-like [Nematolebias whitei]XP_037552927.1 trace amine-associated receptor 1-like [Nematolebias whitei]